MLYTILERMIARGSNAGLQEKLDIFYAAERLTETEYVTLSTMLGGE